MSKQEDRRQAEIKLNKEAGVAAVSNIPENTSITTATDKTPPEADIVIAHKLDDSHWDEEIPSKMKEIDHNIHAMHIPLLGCIVSIMGAGATFVPNASIQENPDGTFDLIKGRIVK